MFTGVFYQRFVLGQWANAEGVIYRNFIVRDEKYQESDILYTDVGVDYGIKSTTAFIMVDYLKNGQQVIRKCYRYDGTVRESSVKTDEQLCEDFFTFISGTKIRYVHVDPSAASFIQTLKIHPGRYFRVMDADNDVLNGIRVTMNMFESGKLIIAPDNSNEYILDEISGYTWDDVEVDRPTKIDDHFCDALRYVTYGNNKRIRKNNPVSLRGTGL